MPAILFGSISTLADTSELQREAFNAAFREHELGWWWSQDDYRAMLSSNGGADRIADYAASREAQVDAAAVHQTKSRIFQALLRDRGVYPRPGVDDTLRASRDNGFDLGLVTTTSPANVEAILGALVEHIGQGSFDIVVTSADVMTPKPHPDAYEFALQQLGLAAADAVAIEDNAGGVRAAATAGLRVLAFPNENTVGGDFSAAFEQVDALDAARVIGWVADQQTDGAR